MSTSYGGPGRKPRLKDSCSNKLIEAWNNEQWSAVVNLTKQLLRNVQGADKDYYEAVALAARSELEHPGDKYAAREEVQRMAKAKVHPFDPWAVDLLDWACRGMPNWSETIGVLRSAVVKMCKRDKEVYKVSLTACIANEDWEHAQEIVKSKGTNIPGDRLDHFNNIVLLYIRANDPKKTQDPKMRALLWQIAKKTIDRAYALRSETPDGKTLPPHAIITEEEMLLWVHIELKLESADANRLKQEGVDAWKAITESHYPVFKAIVNHLEVLQEWGEIFDVCHAVFMRGIELLQKQAETGTQASEGKDANAEKAAAETNAFSRALFDWSLWTQFITAAEKGDRRRSFEQLDNILAKLAPCTNYRIQQKMLDLAGLHVAFSRLQWSEAHPEDDDFSLHEPTMLTGLLDFVNAHYKQVSCFDDLKPFLEKLPVNLLKTFLLNLGIEGQRKENNALKNIMLVTLRFRFRYTVTTSGRAIFESKCGLCEAIVPGDKCEACFYSIAQACMHTYTISFKREQVPLRQALEEEELDPLTDLSIIGALCLLKLAGVDPVTSLAKVSRIQTADLPRLLQAIIWLDLRFQEAPHSTTLRLILVKLFTLIGCVSHAKLLWDKLDVKNVTLDSLGPLFSDRLSSIAPGLWAVSAHAWSPITPYIKHYDKAFSNDIPANLRAAFEQGSYDSILGLLGLKDRLERSCTVVMAIVEESRGIRAVGGKAGLEILEDPLIRRIQDKTELLDATAYGCLPNHEDSSQKPIHDLISIGPGLSHTRMRLSLLAEMFMNLIGWSALKEVRSAKAADVDRLHIAKECMDGFYEMDELLTKGPRVEESLTGPEYSYFKLVCSLQELVWTNLTISLPQNANARPLATSETIDDIIAILKDQTTALNALPGGVIGMRPVFYAFSSLHANGMLRESATAVRMAILTIDAVTEKTIFKANSKAPKWFIEDLEKLKDASNEVFAVLKQRIKLLSDGINEGGWMDRIPEWAFGGLLMGDGDDRTKDVDSLLLTLIETTPLGGLERFPSLVLDSWEDAVKGLAKTKLG
ncbi:N-acetyltransferase B complex non catalytic subunit-domain-containing protein [Pseudomassariella vexata]|uniref:N-acetyltransferase B complex non catalytic subunit-domain-containing protein n=1 Tax=Pseudomassariella vexata TaxID=1141098 RepID=A0A1Y2E5J0_9PEZI|nr:N-acetyltransferase B complex non catalytic subunit-domain-containing protein [Pseudomassariella vexata]ORY66556.1 N-acetyltransferase B complex non catalytic subunit-domain-containing protein [Pseudomassariella vexata]